MTLLAGKCTFTEANGLARVFVLCHATDRTHLVPVSVAGEQDSIRGMKLTRERHQLEISMGRLPGQVQRMTFGMTLTAGHRFDDGVTRALRLMLDSGASLDLPLMVRPKMPKDSRYAIMAVAIRKGMNWNIGALRPPEFYADRTKLAESYDVPSWWTRSHI